MSKVFEEILNVGTRKAIECAEAERCIFSHAWALDLDHVTKGLHLVSLKSQ